MGQLVFCYWQKKKIRGAKHAARHKGWSRKMFSKNPVVLLIFYSSAFSRLVPNLIPTWSQFVPNLTPTCSQLVPTGSSWEQVGVNLEQVGNKFGHVDIYILCFWELEIITCVSKFYCFYSTVPPPPPPHRRWFSCKGLVNRPKGGHV